MTFLVLLPGLDGTGDLLAPLAGRLSDNHQVQIVAYPKDRSLGYGELVDLVSERLPDERFVILGESFSGPIAAEIAAMERDRVAGLILAASFVRHPMPKFLAPLVHMLNLAWAPRSIVAAMLLGSAGDQETKAELSRAIARVSGDVIKKRLHEVFRVDVRHQLSGITCPVLYLQGRNDRLIGNESLKEITKIHPECTVQELDAPHMLLRTHVDQAAAVIDRFCNGLS